MAPIQNNGAQVILKKLLLPFYLNTIEKFKNRKIKEFEEPEIQSNLLQPSDGNINSSLILTFWEKKFTFLL